MASGRMNLTKFGEIGRISNKYAAFQVKVDAGVLNISIQLCPGLPQTMPNTKTSKFCGRRMFNSLKSSWLIYTLKGYKFEEFCS